jgi:hypothetical protein
MPSVARYLTGCPSIESNSSPWLERRLRYGSLLWKTRFKDERGVQSLLRNVSAVAKIVYMVMLTLDCRWVVLWMLATRT